MKKRLSKLLVAGLTCLCMSACSSGGGADSSGQTEPAEETKVYELNTDIKHSGLESYYKENTTAMFSGWGFLPDGLITDADEKDGIVVAVDFTNNSDNSYQFQDVYYIKAYQNGVELDDTFGNSDVFDPVDNWNKSVIKGGKIQVAKIFELIDESPVTVRLYEQMIPDNYTEDTIDLTKEEKKDTAESKKDSKKDKEETVEDLATAISSPVYWKVEYPDTGSYRYIWFNKDNTGKFEGEFFSERFTWKLRNAEEISGLVGVVKGIESDTWVTLNFDEADLFAYGTIHEGKFYCVFVENASAGQEGANVFEELFEKEE